MPTCDGCNWFECLEDKPRWYRTLRDVSKAMIASGWHPGAKKFSDVQRRRALRIYYNH